MSHKVTIGVSVGQGAQKKNRREINIPSVVKGKQVGMREAIQAFFGSGQEGKLNRYFMRHILQSFQFHDRLKGAYISFRST